MRRNKKIFNYIHEIKKSKFISFAFLANTVNDFEDILDYIKQNHQDAKHICYGYKINNNGFKMKIYNSTEPKGTASIPIHTTLERCNLENVAIIIVRYFGKTKIGKSNLFRAYLKSSNEVLNLLINSSDNDR